MFSHLGISVFTCSLTQLWCQRAVSITVAQSFEPTDFTVLSAHVASFYRHFRPEEEKKTQRYVGYQSIKDIL
jgi:hypothetical protein